MIVNHKLHSLASGYAKPYRSSRANGVSIEEAQREYSELVDGSDDGAVDVSRFWGR